MSWWYLAAAMVVWAVMAVSAHTISIAAPPGDEGERIAREAEAAAERAVVPGPAAADGLPVPALLSGIVLAFAVGLTAGQVQRRRRVARRSAEARVRPAPEPTPLLSPGAAPPPPRSVAPPEPKPLVAAAPPPPAPAVRARGQRILRFRPAPAEAPPGAREPVEAPPRAPEPPVHEVVPPPPAREPVEPRADEVVPPPRAAEVVPPPPADEVVPPPPADEVVAPPPAPEPVIEPPADEVVAPPRAPGPEVPRPEPGQPAHEVRTPLGEAPEALRPRPEESVVPPQEHAAAVPVRRFARPEPWPEDAEKLWTCEIAWKGGYLKSTFRAMAGAPGGSRRKSIGESPSLRWTLMTEPEPPTPEMIANVKALVSALADAGWEAIGPGEAWYAERFLWRGSGEPRPIQVPDAVEPAEPPSR